MQEFTVNEFIKLKLETSTTDIYINDKRFTQCKYLLISIPIKEIERWDQFNSMDEVIKATATSESARTAKGLTPQEAFWGHCSNLQAWVESGYNYKVLDTRLSIPIIIQIMEDLLNSHNEEKSYIYPKDYWKDKFRKFFLEVVKSLDNYIKTHLENEYTFYKFNFLYKVLFRTKDMFFMPEEIEGSLLLSKIHAFYLSKKQREIFIRKRSYWERKLWKREPVVENDYGYYVGDEIFTNEYLAEITSKKQNLERRRFLRNIRSDDPHTREIMSVSDRRDYLPYLYAMGKFTNEKSISFMEIENDLYIRDSEGEYWIVI